MDTHAEFEAMMRHPHYRTHGITKGKPVAQKVNDIEWNVDSVPFFNVVTENGDTVAFDLTEKKAQRTRRNLWNLFGIRSHVIESVRIGPNGPIVTQDAQSAFAHDVAHVPADIPMFDIIDNRGKVVAYNLTDAASRDFLENHTGSIGRVRINPAQNNSPVPTVGETYAWKEKPVRAVRIKQNEKELRYQGQSSVPEELRVWCVIDVATLKVVYRGAKGFAQEYIVNAADKKAYKVRNFRVIHRDKLEAYLADIAQNGYRLTHHGVTVCIGTRKEVIAYATAEVADKRMNIANAKVTKVAE